jgi:hypothetical protein
LFDQLEADDIGKPVAEAAGGRGAALVLLGSGWDDRAKANVRIQTGGQPTEVAHGEPIHE